jgi:hypothetical protein
MNAWGVRRVTIENLQWGDPERSLAILRQRSHYKHIRRMIDEMEERMAELKQPVDGGTMVAATTTPPVAPMPPVASAPPTPVKPAIPVVAAPPIARAEPVPASRPSAITGRAGVSVNNARPAIANNPFFGPASTTR